MHDNKTEEGELRLVLADAGSTVLREYEVFRQRRRQPSDAA